MNVILRFVNVSRPRLGRLLSVFGRALMLACLSAYVCGACAQAAVASSRQFEVLEDTPLQESLANTDPNGAAMSFRLTMPPVHGQLQLAAGGAFTYIPEKDFDAYDSFRYVATDGTSDSAEATVGLMMKPVNDAPEARPFALSVPKNRTLIGRLQGFDVDRDSITYWKASDPAHGTATVDFLGGRFTYTPVPDFAGDDSFGYQVRDSAGIDSAPATVSLHVGSDGVGVIADTLIPQVVTADFPAGPGSGVFAAANPVPGIAAGVIDQAVDRVNRRLYVLTGTGLNVYDIDRAQTPPSLSYRLLDQFPVTGSHVVLSLDGRTAFIGAKDKVTAVNLYDEAVYVAKDQSTMMLRGSYKREFPFPEPCRSRGVAAMGVHPAGDRLFVIVDMDPSDRKRNINNDLLRSDAGNGTSADNVALPADFGFLLELDISADVQTEGGKRTQPEFSPPVNIRKLLFADVVVFGIKSIAFSPDGNYALLSAVGAQTPRATPFGIMPTTDEGTGGILVVDVRPGTRILPDNRFLAFIPTTERGEKTPELRREIQKQGFKIVHPQVQAARRNYSIASGVLPIAAANQFTATEAVNELILGAIVLDELERSYADYGYMEAYMDLYPRDMVGASSVAISHDGGFGVVALQDTNNLGLLSLALSTQVSGYTPGSQPDFYIARGTRKTVNGFDPALGPPGSSQNQVPLSWAYPQEIVFTSDDSRIYIGMAGGIPKADSTNKFGSADAFMLRRERDRSDSIFAGASPSIGYAVYGGTSTVPLKSPRVAAALQAFDSSRDQLSDQLKAYNRWNSLRPFTDEQKHKLVSTDEAHLTIPGRPMPIDSSTPDCLSFGYLLPPSGVGYRLNRFGMPVDATSFATRGVVSTIEQMGLEWDKRYREHQAGVPSQQPITRPYFVVGLLSQPGGGIIRNRSEEALKYAPGNGSEVDFPYFSIGSDSAHDFIVSNGPNKPSDNSVEEVAGFDKVNTEALIRLLLAQPQVKSIELDPLVLDQLPGLAGDSRIVVHGSSGVGDWRRDLDNHMFVTFGCASVDLDIDSDNNGVLDRSPGEDAIEDRSDAPGKFVSPNTGDADNDSVPNYADGYDRFPGQGAAGASAKFTELKVRFPDGLDLALLQFRLIYSESSPSAVGDAPDYTLPTDGAFRIWTKDGDQARSMAPINQGGDFIPSNRTFMVTLLNTGADRIATLFVESVGTGVKPTDRDIIIEVIPIAGSPSSVSVLADRVVTSTLGVALAVDSNRDGQVTFSERHEGLSGSAPTHYRFWLNDDDDNESSALVWDEPDPEHYAPRRADSADRIINSDRDCEDLTRLWIKVTGHLTELKSPAENLYLGLKWKVEGEGVPQIRLFRALDPLGGLSHIKSLPAARNQVSGADVTSPKYCLLDEAVPDSNDPEATGGDAVAPMPDRVADFIFKKRDLAGLTDATPAMHLLFEGVSEGAGQLIPVFLRRRADGSWEIVSEGLGVALELKNIRRMYMRAHSTPYSKPDHDEFPLPYEASVAQTTPCPPYVADPIEGNYTGGAIRIPDSALGFAEGDDITDPDGAILGFERPAGEKAECIVFVHGIDLDIAAQLGYAESFFKRLWWEGYRGRLATFRWNTTLDDHGRFLEPGRENTSIFNSGEYRSWKAGAALKKYVEVALRPQLEGNAVISIAAHSLGNACAGEALRQGLQAESYVALEAAVPLSCYYAEPGDHASDPLATSFDAGLLQADIATPTPHYTSAIGYAGYLWNITGNSNARCIAYQNADDFWLRTGKTRKVYVPISPSGVFPVVFAELQADVDWYNYQRTKKPDDRYGFGQYLYENGIPYFERGVGPLGFSRPVREEHEGMAYVSRSRTLPLGAEPPSGKETPTGFIQSVNMKLKYGFTTHRADHSGQFQRSIQLMYADELGQEWGTSFYKQLMFDLGVSR